MKILIASLFTGLASTFAFAADIPDSILINGSPSCERNYCNYEVTMSSGQLAEAMIPVQQSKPQPGEHLILAEEQGCGEHAALMADVCGYTAETEEGDSVDVFVLL